jgi:hypothetical protein
MKAVQAMILVALSAMLAGCGSNGRPSTSLRIQVGESGTGVRAYRLRCDPGRGTAPHPGEICRVLARHANLLVGGPGLGHSCPSSFGTMVTGRYKSHSVNAFFGICAWVPGQGNGLDEWGRLLVSANRTAPTTVHFRWIAEHISARELARRQKRLRLAARLRAESAKLVHHRAAALAAGRLHPAPGKPDALTLHILRNFAMEVGLPDGPFPAEARVYSDRRRYLLVLKFDYVDYTGAKHRAAGGMTFSLPPKSLRTSTMSLGALPSLAGLGPGTALPL